MKSPLAQVCVAVLFSLACLPASAQSDGGATWGYTSGAELPSEASDIVQLEGGGVHALFLHEDGHVTALSLDGGEPQQLPSGLRGVVQVAAGYEHSLALLDDGSVVAWGANAFGQTELPDGLSGVARVAAGYYHSLALLDDGSVVVWGYDYFGQATPPASLGGVVQVAAGYGHSLALRSDGTVVAWGSDTFGQASTSAVEASVALLSAGGWSSLALYGEPEALPVELAAFEATLEQPDRALLSWRTASETNNSGFAVEHRAPGSDWIDAGWVAGAGTTLEAQRYEFAVGALAVGTHAFRLRQTDLDGATELSAVVEVTVASAALLLSVTNPARSAVSARFTVTQTDHAQVELYALTGQRLRVLYDDIAHSDQTYRLGAEASDLAAGTYMLRLRTSSGSVTQPFVVVR